MDYHFPLSNFEAISDLCQIPASIIASVPVDNTFDLYFSIAGVLI